MECYKTAVNGKNKCGLEKTIVWDALPTINSDEKTEMVLVGAESRCRSLALTDGTLEVLWIAKWGSEQRVIAVVH
ncbi:hypothetical protein GOBAR_AA18056 [Gossypium barbadense]|uniref:Uncharacterized protein n=1 Tax=Gossypium barbadense TaxID=3634 RepID=A0A2P5XGX8_GOSBA|nr:hypothetical protein GOBAR_AA18056 [Gossypium barbadense]